MGNKQQLKEDRTEAVRLLDRSDLLARGIRYSRVHLDRLMRDGKFPRSIALGENRRAWVEREIDDFIARKIAERDSAAGVAE